MDVKPVSENLKSGFDNPIDAQRVLSQLPDGETRDPNDGSVTSAVIA